MAIGKVTCPRSQYWFFYLCLLGLIPIFLCPVLCSERLTYIEGITWNSFLSDFWLFSVNSKTTSSLPQKRWKEANVGIFIPLAVSEAPTFGNAVPSPSRFGSGGLGGSGY